jgi:hypothetical protein
VIAPFWTAEPEILGQFPQESGNIEYSPKRPGQQTETPWLCAHPNPVRQDPLPGGVSALLSEQAIQTSESFGQQCFQRESTAMAPSCGDHCAAQNHAFRKRDL